MAITKVKSIPAALRRKLLEGRKPEAGGCMSWPNKSGKIGTGKAGKSIRAYELAFMVDNDTDKPGKLANVCGDNTCCNGKHWVNALEGEDPEEVTVLQELQQRDDGVYFVRNRTTNQRRWNLATKDKNRALERWMTERPYLIRGETPPPRKGSSLLTVGQLVTLYLLDLRQRMHSGEVLRCHYNTQKSQAQRMVKELGRKRPVGSLTTEDFDRLGRKVAETAKKSYRTKIDKMKSPFRWGHKTGKIGAIPRWGENFPMPAGRKETQENRKARVDGRRFSTERDATFDRDEVIAMLAIADKVQTAWIYLGLNLALGDKEVNLMQVGDFDIDDESGRYWFTISRVKNAGKRKSVVWLETINACRDAYLERPDARREMLDSRYFLSPRGCELITEANHSAFIDRFNKLQEEAGVYSKGRGFHALRHTFKTQADDYPDVNAVELFMGHKNSSIEAVYRHGVGDTRGDERLQGVADIMHDWLFHPEKLEQRGKRKRIRQADDLSELEALRAQHRANQ